MGKFGLYLVIFLVLCSNGKPKKHVNPSTSDVIEMPSHHDNQQNGTAENEHGHHEHAEMIPSTAKSGWDSYKAVIKERSLSPCYGAINYHIFEKNLGRIDVTEKDTAQFSLSLNRTMPIYFNSTGDCSLIWVRVSVEDFPLYSAALVDSDTDVLGSKLVNSRIVALHGNARFPTRLYARGIFLGYSKVHFQALPTSIDTTEPNFNASQIDDSQWITFRTAKIATHRLHHTLDIIFQIVIFTMIIFGNTGIGLDINWEEIRDVLKKPIGPAIGFCCQYIVMPLSAFAVVNLIDLPPNIALGIFLIGCAPGGNGSNFHSYFLGGNLPLSVTMTFVSTLAAIGMMPLWVFTLGRLVNKETETGIKVDFRGIFIALFNSVVPFVFGILVHWRRPVLARRIFRVYIRPLLICIFIYMLTVGSYTNVYLFKLMQPKVLLSGVMLPYVGFTVGFIVALALRQTFSFAITIAIETGIQNIGVAITTLFLSLPQPDADIAIVGPISVAMFTPIPLWIAELIRGVYLCIKKKRCFVCDSCRGITDDDEKQGEEKKKTDDVEKADVDAEAEAGESSCSSSKVRMVDDDEATKQVEDPVEDDRDREEERPLLADEDEPDSALAPLLTEIDDEPTPISPRSIIFLPPQPQEEIPEQPEVVPPPPAQSCDETDKANNAPPEEPVSSTPPLAQSNNEVGADKDKQEEETSETLTPPSPNESVYFDCES